MKKLIALFSVAILSIGAAGCSSSNTEVANTEVAAVKKPLDVSLAVSYDSAEEMAVDANWIVRAKTIAAEEIEWHGVPFTVTTIEIVEALSGSGLSSQIKVLQTGNHEFYVEGLADVLTVGEEYILFLQPLEAEPPVEGADYTVVGFGAYRAVEGEEDLYQFDENTKPPLREYDEEITLEEIQEII